jgi:hypothetical protein
LFLHFDIIDGCDVSLSLKRKPRNPVMKPPMTHGNTIQRNHSGIIEITAGTKEERGEADMTDSSNS